MHAGLFFAGGRCWSKMNLWGMSIDTLFDFAHTVPNGAAEK